MVVQKLRLEFTHAQDFLFKIAAQSVRMHSRRNFWTTNLKSSVQYTNALVRMVWVTTSVWLCMALVATGEVSHLLLLDSCQVRVTTSMWLALAANHTCYCLTAAKLGSLQVQSDKSHTSPRHIAVIHCSSKFMLREREYVTD